MPSKKRKVNEIARDLKKVGTSKGQQKINFTQTFTHKRSVSVDGERSSGSLDVSSMTDVGEIPGTDELCSEILSNEVGDFEKTVSSMTDVGETTVTD